MQKSWFSQDHRCTSDSGEVVVRTGGVRVRVLDEGRKDVVVTARERRQGSSKSQSMKRSREVRMQENVFLVSLSSSSDSSMGRDVGSNLMRATSNRRRFSILRRRSKNSIPEFMPNRTHMGHGGRLLAARGAAQSTARYRMHGPIAGELSKRLRKQRSFPQESVMLRKRCCRLRGSQFEQTTAQDERA